MNTNELWSVAVSENGKVYLEDNDFKHSIRLYVDGKFNSLLEHIEYASTLARKLNGTYIE